MRKPYQLMFLLLGVLTFVVPAAVLADIEQDASVLMPEYKQFVSKASRLRTSDANDPDTVWIGHIADPAWRPRNNLGVMDALTYPGIVTGGYGPYHVGRGDNFPGLGPGASYNGVWDFDSFQPGETDSLMGWWPLARPFQSGDAVNSNDRARPFFGLDYGNQGNYVINQGSPKRTFGVTGYWHRDVGNNVPGLPDTGSVIPGPDVEWAPLAGGASAWCGLRGATDATHVDPITGNAYNQTVLSYRGNNAYFQQGSTFFADIDPGPGVNLLGGTDANFPGYGSQWDQMLYQDVVVDGSSATPITIDFLYSTAMSTVRGGTATQRIGYFYKDPKKFVVQNDGNFISATDAEATQGGPVDSFMVYIGKPADDANCRYSDGSIAPVYDPQRRWFSEVLALDGSNGLGWVRQLLSAAGTSAHPTDFPAAVITPASLVSQGMIAAAANQTIRLVFRVKTNRGSDDEDYGIARAFNSGTRGAAIVDNVTVTQGGGNLVDFGDFESGSSVDNLVHTFPIVSSTTNESTTVTSAALFGSVVVGMPVTGVGIPANTIVTSKANASTITISNAATATGSSTLTYDGMALLAWKSTGKPPGIYTHVHTIDPNVIGAAAWNDPCSPPDFADPSAPNRPCNMISNVLTGGDHDNAEKPGGEFGAPDQDRMRWTASPTINLMNGGVGVHNGMGIDAEVADATQWWFFGEYHSPGFRGNTNGNFFSWALQSYPAKQPNGLAVWGETRAQLTIFFQAVQGCFQTAFNPKAGGLILSTNANGIPDSIRVYLQMMSRCYTATHSSSTCSPVSPSIFTGSHFDNISFALIDVTPPPGLTVSPWFKYSDAFPATGTTNFASANFDTCAAWVKSGFNAHVDNIGLTKPDIQGDSAWIGTGTVAGIRVDLVFRILPGVGNYVQIGNRASGIRRIPTSSTAATSADAGNGALTSTQKFWGAYMANNGQYGTNPSGHDADTWDPDTWNSARMDTLEKNLFPCLNLGNNIPTLDPGQWHTTYHELDPKYTILGLSKNRCFVVDPSVGRGTGCTSKTTTSVVQCNLICGTHPVSPLGYPPPWTSDLTSGMNPSENGLPPGRTYEYTKMIPDGLLTPGAHVQYFFRREPGAAAAVDYLPDTNFVFNAFADAARWYHFSVLPDRWKDPAFGFGTGMACMLVDDVGDRRLDELFWVSVSDSIGMTSASKRGAHNGWKARSDEPQNSILNADDGSIGSNDDMAVRPNLGQPGSLWDMWNTTAGESQTTGAAWLANRSAAQPAAGELTEGKGTRTGPTGDMLRNFYRTMMFLTGDLTSNIFGKAPNRTADELAMLNDFAAIPSGTAKPRGVTVIGQGFAENLRNTPGLVGGDAFLNTYFGTSFVNGVYRTYSGNPVAVSKYDPAPGSALDLAGAGVGIGGMKFGLSDGCGLENDVLAVNVAVPTAVAQVFHENVGANGPYVASVYAPNAGAREHITYYDGGRIQRVGGIITYNPISGAPQLPLSNAGLRAYMYKALTIVAGGLGCGPQGAPVGVGDGTGSGNGSAFVDFMNLRSSNPMRSGQARIAFGLAKSDKVQIRIYDVTGRLVKTVADRMFLGGQEHVVVWDGTSEAGERVKSGVYFYQLKTPHWTSQKKLAVLAN